MAFPCNDLLNIMASLVNLDTNGSKTYPLMDYIKTDDSIMQLRKDAKIKISNPGTVVN